jgi:hypothetical protein
MDATNGSAMSEPRLGPSDFKAEIERMIRAGTMPSLEEVLNAVSEARDKFAEKILEARKLGEGRGHEPND